MTSAVNAAPEVGAGAPDGELVARVQRRTVRTLLASQLFGSVGVAMAFAVSALAATALAHSATRAGVAQGISAIGTIVATLVLAKLTVRSGRRPALSLGYLIAAVGGVVCVIAIAQRHFVAFVVGSALFAVASATNLQARFAAVDLARAGRISTNVSLVVWMATVGAVLGPQLATAGGYLARGVDLPPWAGAYALSALAFLVAAVILAVFLRPDPLRLALSLTYAEARRRDPASPRPEGAPTRTPAGLREGIAAIRSSATAMIALGAAAVGQAVMIGLMIWTPLHMADSGQGWIGVVLSGHLLGMYAFAPLLGWLADRVGKLLMVACGCLLMMVSLALAGMATGQQHILLLVALWLLGVAWALLLITGSGLFTEHIAPSHRAAAQGVFDGVVWTATAIANAVTGWLLDVAGYTLLCVGGMVAVALPATVVWLRFFARAHRKPLQGDTASGEG